MKLAIDIKNGQAVGNTGIISETIKASGNNGATLITKLGNETVREKSVPSDWKKSMMLTTDKGKGDAFVRGNCRGLKLLEHRMEVLERVL